MRKGHGYAGKRSLQKFADTPFVLVIDDGPKQTHANGFDVETTQLNKRLEQSHFVQRPNNLAAGTTMWDQPVSVDITKRYRPGQKNRIVVRVHNSLRAGGIWKPIRLIAE